MAGYGPGPVASARALGAHDERDGRVTAAGKAPHAPRYGRRVKGRSESTPSGGSERLRRGRNENRVVVKGVTALLIGPLARVLAWLIHPDAIDSSGSRIDVREERQRRISAFAEADLDGRGAVRLVQPAPHGVGPVVVSCEACCVNSG